MKSNLEKSNPVKSNVMSSLSHFTVVRALLLVLSVLAGNTLYAESTSPAVGVAVVDVEGAIFNSNYAQTAIKALNKNALVEDMKTKEAALKKLQEEKKVNWELTWGDDQKKAFNERFKKAYGEYQALGKQLQAEKAKVEKQIGQALNPKVMAILSELVKEKQIHILVKAGAVYYREPEYDLTKTLLARLNEVTATDANGDKSDQ